jgi:two-component system, OmpR family, response regulator QseB
MNRILIVEDESRIAAFLEKGFRANGFITTIVPDGRSAVRYAIEDDFDLVILDLGLPGKDGLLVLEELRGQGFHNPVIILTARDDVNDKVNGLEHGADDYVTKPFHFDELLARVRVRLRTSKNLAVAGQAEMMLQMRNLRLDLRTRRVYVNDRLVELSAREFTLAETFLRHPDQVMSREQLLNHVWGYDYDPGSNIVDVYVGYLRKKLGDDLIETVRGVGYRMRS